MVHVATYDTLVEFRPDDLTKVVPKLADKWDISPDGKSYTFYLHPGVKFVSGNPVTAEDVRFSWTRLKNLKGNPSFYTELIKDITVVDDTTVKVTLTEASPAFLSILTAPAMSIVDSKVVKKHGGTDAQDADQTDKAKDWLDQNSAGSGPFILTQWTPKAEIVLEANPNYWRGAPKVEKIIIKHVGDPSTQLQLLQRGDVDVVQNLDKDLVDQVKDDPNLNLIVGQTLNIVYLAMSPSGQIAPELADKRVRQAIAYAIDYDGIIQGLLKGYADRAPTIIPLGMMGVDRALVRNQDVEKAKALLKEARYENGFTVDLAFSTGMTEGVLGETLAAKIQSDLDAIGIEVNLVPKEHSVFLSEFRAQKLAFLFSLWTPDYLDPTMWADYFAIAGKGVAKRILFEDPTATQLAKEGASTLDPARRAEIYRQLQEVLVDELPYVLLFQPQTLIATSKQVKGYAFHPVQFVNLYDLSK